MGAEDYACLRRRASWTPETALRKLGESREGLWGVGEENRLERKVLALWARVCGRQGVGARGGLVVSPGCTRRGEGAQLPCRAVLVHSPALSQGSGPTGR